MGALDAMQVTGQTRSVPIAKRTKVNYDAYILGPGDGLQIELLDLPELSGRFTIGPDGTLYLPRLRALYVEGLTLEELRNFLTKQFSTYVRDQGLCTPSKVRMIRVYVGGEVRRPGFYTLTGVQFTSEGNDRQTTQQSDPRPTQIDLSRTPITFASRSSSATSFHCVRCNPQCPRCHTMQISKVEVVRKRAEALEGDELN